MGKPESTKPIDAQVIAIIEDQLGVDREEITRDSTFRDDLGADSLDAIELVMTVEEAFGVEISDETAETLTTVGQLIAHVEQLVAKKAQGAA